MCCAVLRRSRSRCGVLCGVALHTLQSVRNRETALCVGTHRRDDTWGLSLEQATASMHSLSRVRLQFSEREMQVAPGGHTSNYSPLSPQA